MAQQGPPRSGSGPGRADQRLDCFWRPSRAGCRPRRGAPGSAARCRGAVCGVAVEVGGPLVAGQGRPSPRSCSARIAGRRPGRRGRPRGTGPGADLLHPGGDRGEAFGVRAGEVAVGAVEDPAAAARAWVMVMRSMGSSLRDIVVTQSMRVSRAWATDRGMCRDCERTPAMAARPHRRADRPKTSISAARRARSRHPRRALRIPRKPMENASTVPERTSSRASSPSLVAAISNATCRPSDASRNSTARPMGSRRV